MPQQHATSATLPRDHTSELSGDVGVPSPHGNVQRSASRAILVRSWVIRALSASIRRAAGVPATEGEEAVTSPPFFLDPFPPRCALRCFAGIVFGWSVSDYTQFEAKSSRPEVV
jgi:hypothetical protein